MKKEWLDIITEKVGISPVMINSSLVSAQRRKRYYWTNIYMRQANLFEVCSDIPQPADKGLMISDIIESDVDEKYHLSKNVVENLLRHLERNKEKGNGFGVNFKT